VLLATEECGRGVDEPGVACVINFEVPRDLATYTQRVGRAGRFGRAGTAITIVSADEDVRLLKSLPFAVPLLDVDHMRHLPGSGSVAVVPPPPPTKPLEVATELATHTLPQPQPVPMPVPMPALAVPERAPIAEPALRGVENDSAEMSLLRETVAQLRCAVEDLRAELRATAEAAEKAADRRAVEIQAAVQQGVLLAMAAFRQELMHTITSPLDVQEAKEEPVSSAASSSPLDGGKDVGRDDGATGAISFGDEDELEAINSSPCQAVPSPGPGTGTVLPSGSCELEHAAKPSQQLAFADASADAAWVQVAAQKKSIAVALKSAPVKPYSQANVQESKPRAKAAMKATKAHAKASVRVADLKGGEVFSAVVVSATLHASFLDFNADQQGYLRAGHNGNPAIGAHVRVRVIRIPADGKKVVFELA
jgi:hypothetical protein